MHDSILRTKKFSFIGAGIIARVFVERLLKAGVASPGGILATDTEHQRLDEIRKQFQIQVSEQNLDAVRFGDIVFAAVPPNAMKPVLEEVGRELRPSQMLVSLAAAIPTSFMEGLLPAAVPILRVIPNTPSLVGEGMNPHCLGGHVTEEHLPFVDSLLEVFGKTIRIDEALMNTATVLTAVGPTYVFPVLHALEAAAMEKGLPEAHARFAAAQTVLGAARLVLETGQDPDTLKLMIGLRTISEEEVNKVMKEAFAAAFEKIAQSELKLTGVGG